MSTCLVCKKGEIIKKEQDFEWYNCTHCGADSDRLIDGILYPLKRRGTLCSHYTPVVNLQVKDYKNGDTVGFLTIRNTPKKAKVIHVDYQNNQMILEEFRTERIRFVVDNEEIVNAYDALFPENKIKFAGWWNRRIKWDQ